jgi:hypothetical protein
MNKKNSWKKEMNEDLKGIILQTIKTQNPQTTREIVKSIQKKKGLTKQEINNLLQELENQDKLHFTRKQTALLSTLREYVFSKKVAWYWVTLALSVSAAISVFTIPENAYLFDFIRSALGVLFVLFLPGYAFIKMLFPLKVPIVTSSTDMDNIERIALSIGVSLALTPMVGLALHYTPQGIGPAPITLSLLALTVVLATAAVVREFQSK